MDVGAARVVLQEYEGIRAGARIGCKEPRMLVCYWSHWNNRMGEVIGARSSVAPYGRHARHSPMLLLGTRWSPAGAVDS